MTIERSKPQSRLAVLICRIYISTISKGCLDGPQLAIFGSPNQLSILVWFI